MIIEPRPRELTIERMYSRVKQPCKFIGTKESVYIRKKVELPQDWLDETTWQKKVFT